MHITSCAQTKILQMLVPGKAFRITSSGSAKIGSHIALEFDQEMTPQDCVISINPLIVMDYHSATMLANRVVDFDPTTEEFLISNRGK